MENSDDAVADLDELDIRLLEHIEKDFDVSLEDLSERLGVSKSAIHYRLSKLREKDVITGVSADLDPLAFGLNMVILSDVSVTHDTGYAEEIGSQLTEIDGVEQVYYTMGDVDFVVISRVQNRTQMNRLIDEMVAIDGVNETSSRFIMRELKTDTTPLANMSDSMKETVVDCNK